VIAPTLTAIALVSVLWLATTNFDTVLGVAPGSPVRTVIPIAYVAAMLEALVAAAFSDLVVAGWLVPVPNDWPRALYGSFRILIGHALDHGAVHLSADRLPPRCGSPRHPPTRHGPLRAATAAGCGPYTPWPQVESMAKAVGEDPAAAVAGG
jgi:hypothetical protein